MTSPAQNANVVLTADTSQYQQGMQQSTQQTNMLGKAVDSLSAKLDGITKRAGKKLFAFTAADMAVFGTGVAAAATFEKQLSSLQATTKVTGANFKELKGGIENTFQSFPVARGQVIQLAESLTMLGRTSAKDITELTRTFTKLGAATGEGPQELAQGLTQLSQLMGTQSTTKIEQYANSLLTVSKNAGVSATSVVNFANSIAPLARQAGIGQAQILGISTAFSKAGADGFVATNVFNSLVSTITNLSQTGSPELEKYASLIGKTANQFKQMDKTEALTSIFETISRQGPKAIQTLNQLGIDGIRAQSAISAVVQSGDLRQQVSRAVGASNDTKNLNKGSEAAFGGLADELTNVRNQFTQFGTEIGQHLLGPLEKITELFAKVLSIGNAIIKPFTPLIDAVGALVGAFTAMGGAALIAFGVISKIATLRFALTSSPIAALRGGYAAGRNPDVVNPASAAYAAGNMRPYQSAFYRVGAGAGSIAGPGMGQGPSLVARGANVIGRAPFQGVSFLANAQRNFFQDSTRQAFNRSGDAAYAARQAAAPAPTPAAGPSGFFATMRSNFREGMRPQAPVPGAAAPIGTRATPPGAQVGRSAYEQAAAKEKAEKEAAKATAANAKATENATKATRAGAVASTTNTAATRSLAGTAAKASGDMLRMGASAAAAGARLAGMGIAAGAGALGRLAGSPLGMIGLSLAIPSIINAFSGDDGPSDYEKQTSVGKGNNITKYDEKLGTTSTNLSKFSTEVAGASDRLKNLAGQPISKVSKITAADVASTNNDYKVTDDTFKIFKGKGGVGAGAAYVQSLASQHGGIDAQLYQSIKTDLISQVGVTQAGKILDTYNKSGGAGGGTPSIDYKSLGSYGNNVNRDDYKKLSDQVFTTIDSQSQLNPGKKSSSAELNALLNYGTSSLAPGKNGRGDKTKYGEFGAQLDRLFGTKYFKEALGNGAANYLNTGSDPRTLFSTLLEGNRRDKSKNKPIEQLLNQSGITDKELKRATELQQAITDNPGDKNAAKRAAAYERTLYGKLDKNSVFGAPSDKGGALNDIAMTGPLGEYATKALKDVIGTGKDIANPQKQVEAQDKLKAKSLELTGSLDKAADANDKLADSAERLDPALAALARSAAASQRATFENTVVPTMDRGSLTIKRREDYQKAQAANRGPNANESTAQREQETKQAYEQQEESNRQHLLSMYMSLKSYNLQMERSRADYYKSVYRQQRDFQISMQHSQRDYNIQRSRQQQDFDLQMTRQAKEAAKTIYNPYQRVYDQQTTDVGTLMMNLTEQNKRIQDQLANLKRLKKAGITQDTIDTLNLADPQNAQQLQTVVDGITDNPNVVTRINSAVKKRMKTTTKLTQSDFNETFRNTVDDFNKSFTRMADDFERQRSDAVDAMNRGLNDMATDYATMTDRAAEDMKNSMEEVTGTFESLLPKTFKKLGDEIGKYAPKYADAIQRELDRITPPEFGGNNGGGSGSGGGGGGGGGGGSAAPSGSKSNPIYTPGTVGRNEQGKIGSYDKNGNFKAVDGRTAQSLGSDPKLKYIGNPKNDIVKRHIAKTPAESRKYARAKMLQKYGWGDAQWEALNQLWSHESAWQPSVANHEGSGAYGIPQALPGNKMASAGNDWRWNGATQVDWGLGYIKGRYGTPAKAWAFWQNPGTGPGVSHGHWYDNGGVLAPGVHKTVVNATGKNELILTHKQMKALHTNGMGSTVNNVYKVMNDNSSTFRDITVIASDPMAMAKALKARERLQKLTGAAKGSTT